MVTAEACARYSVLDVRGALRAPLTGELYRQVERLLRGGARWILLDLDALADIDAAGIGELLRAYERTNKDGGGAITGREGAGVSADTGCANTCRTPPPRRL